MTSPLLPPISPRMLSYPVSLPSFVFKPYYVFEGSARWDALSSRNGAFFYSEERELFNFLRLLRRSAKVNKLLLECHLILVGKSWQEEIFLPLVSKGVFSVTAYSTMGEALTGLERVQQAILEETSRRRLGEPQRRVTFPLILMGRECVPELVDPTVNALLTHLLEEGWRARLFPWIITSSAQSFPSALHGTLSWSAYLGEGNRAFAQAHFQLPLGLFAAKRRIVGYLRRTSGKELVVLHDLKYVKSAHQEALEAHQQAEAQAFQKLLASLPGSE